MDSQKNVLVCKCLINKSVLLEKKIFSDVYKILSKKLPRSIIYKCSLEDVLDLETQKMVAFYINLNLYLSLFYPLKKKMLLFVFLFLCFSIYLFYLKILGT